MAGIVISGVRRTFGTVRAVDGVSYELKSGETLGVVGESGCGKSVSALSILRLVANPPGRIVGGAMPSDHRRTGTPPAWPGRSPADRGNRLASRADQRRTR